MSGPINPAEAGLPQPQPAAASLGDHPKTAPPLYGILSVTMLFLAALIFVAVGSFTKRFVFLEKHTGWFALLAVALFPVGTLAAGMVGISRHERKRWLAITGVTVSLASSFIAFLENIFPAGLDTVSTLRAEAFLFAGSNYADLPRRVEISIDGSKRVFENGDPSYDELRKLLFRHGPAVIGETTPGSVHKAGPCGALVLWSYGIRTKFRIIRPKAHEDLFKIKLPNLNYGGFSYPVFTQDPRVIDLVKAKPL